MLITHIIHIAVSYLNRILSLGKVDLGMNRDIAVP